MKSAESRQRTTACSRRAFDYHLVIHFSSFRLQLKSTSEEIQHTSKPMATKGTHARMTREQKRALREYHAAHPTLTQHSLAEWATREFKLPSTLCRMTLYRVLNGPALPATLNPARKTSHKVTSPALEAALLQWFRQCEDFKLPVVTGATIREKAAKIRDDLVHSAEPDAAAVLKAMSFSPGWLCKFQDRHRLTSKRACSEAASVSRAAVTEGRALLQEATRGYDKRNIFNMDETAFFYCASPSKSISTGCIAGRKQGKKRLTVAVCCNADGSTKLPLLFVGAVRKPPLLREAIC